LSTFVWFFLTDLRLHLHHSESAGYRIKMMIKKNDYENY
jgi:hypothetical protein